MSAIKMTGDEIRAWRLEAEGATQQQLAEVLGVSVRTVSGWERGEHTIPNWLLHALAGAKKRLLSLVRLQRRQQRAAARKRAKRQAQQRKRRVREAERLRARAERDDWETRQRERRELLRSSLRVCERAVNGQSMPGDHERLQAIHERLREFDGEAEDETTGEGDSP